MTDMLEQKRYALESLLQAMEELKVLVQDDRFMDLDTAVSRQEDIVREINALDREARYLSEQQAASSEEVEKLKALVDRIAEINDGLIVTITARVKEAQQELGALHRGADATAEYRRQAIAKI